MSGGDVDREQIFGHPKALQIFHSEFFPFLFSVLKMLYCTSAVKISGCEVSIKNSLIYFYSIFY